MDVGPVQVVEPAGAAAAVEAVEGRLVDPHPEAVAGGEAEELEAPHRGVLVEEVEVAVPGPGIGLEGAPPAVDPEEEVGEAEVARETQAEHVGDQRLVDPEREGRQAEVEGGEAPGGQVLALHGQHRREGVAVAGREAARGEHGPLGHEGGDRAEDAARGGLVAVGMDDGRPVEEDQGLAHVAAAHEEAGAVVDHGGAGEGLQGPEDVGGGPGGGDHVQGGEGDVLLLAGGPGAGRDRGLAELDEDPAQHQATAAVSPGARCTVSRAGSQPMKVATIWRLPRCRLANRKRPSRPVAAPSVVPASCTLAKGTGSPSASTT